MKKMIMLMLITGLVTVMGLWATGQKFMACINTNGNGKHIKYGQKRGDVVSHTKCVSLWNKHSYKVDTVAHCALKREGRTIIDHFGVVYCAADKIVKECCQAAYPLRAQEM